MQVGVEIDTYRNWYGGNYPIRPHARYDDSLTPALQVGMSAPPALVNAVPLSCIQGWFVVVVPCFVVYVVGWPALESSDAAAVS
jgi:hypothetical protein